MTNLGNGAPPGAARPTVRRAFVGLGSNLGDRRAFLEAAVADLPDVVAVSPVYETDPVGGPDDQGCYLNAVVELWTSLSPHQLLGAARRAEEAARRVRGPRWGPRTLDVDILMVGELTVDDDELTVPHPRMWERGFVLVPLADLAPDLVDGALGGGLDALGAGLGRGVRAAGMLAAGPELPGSGS